MNQLIDNPDKILHNINIELSKGVNDRNHGFHTPVFSNINLNGQVESRIIVLRLFDFNKMKINFHSDIRSKKINEIKSNFETNLLFYDYKIKLQLRIKTLSMIHYNDQITKMAWSKTKPSSRKCYLSEKSPSSFSSILTDSLPKHLKGIDPSIEESEKGYKNFAVISNQIKTIDWLYLSAMGHKRLLITINNNKQNIYRWLIP